MSGGVELAMAFCREVLGWRQPVDRRYGESEKDPFGNPSKAWTPYVFDYDAKHPQFHYTEFNHVLTAAHAWCSKQTVEIHFSRLLDLGDGPTYRVIVGTPRHESIGQRSYTTTLHVLGMAQGDDPCQAIMAACLAANRRLKAEA